MTAGLYVSTAGFKHLETLPAVLKYMADAGIECVELSGGLRHYDGDVSVLLKKWAKQAGFRYITHNYFPVPYQPFLLNIASTDDETRERSRMFCRDSLYLSAEIGAQVYGVHAGYAGDLRDRGDGYFFPDKVASSADWHNEVERCYQFLLQSVEYLSPIARQLGVKLCIENLYPAQGLPPQLFTGLDDWKRFLNDTRGSGAGILLDLAHLKYTEISDGEDFSAAVHWALTEGKENIFQFHISGTDGPLDSHSPLEKDSWVLSCLRSWAEREGWPQVPLSYESRGLSQDHLSFIMPLIRYSLLPAKGICRIDEVKK